MSWDAVIEFVASMRVEIMTSPFRMLWTTTEICVDANQSFANGTPVSLADEQLNKDGSGAKLLKSAVVKTPLSVYEATAGREMYRPVQTSPISNFFLAGCFTKQKYLASMEGATFSGKLAARAVSDAAIAGTVSGHK